MRTHVSFRDIFCCSPDSRTALTPFHKNTAGTFWNSNDVRNIRNLGYTYPELANNPSIATLTANINKQYGGPADLPVTASSSKTRALKVAEPLEKYFAQVNLPAYGLDDGKDGSLAYNILIFAGEVGNDASSWVTSSNMIGIASTLGGVGMKQDLTLTSLIDITPTLTKALEDGSTTSEKAVDYLKEKLSYRIEIVSFHPHDLERSQLTHSRVAKRYRGIVYQS